MGDELKISSRELSLAGSLIRSMKGTTTLRINGADGSVLPADAIEALALSPTLSALDRFEMVAMELDPSVLTAIGSSNAIGKLKHLAIVDCNLSSSPGEDVAAWVSEVSRFSSLTSLELVLSDIGPGGIASLAFSKTLTSLERLRIVSNNIGDAGICTIVDLPIWQQLVSLFVEDSKLTDAAVTALLNADEPTRLSQLSVRGVGISSVALAALDQRYGTRIAQPSDWSTT